MFDSIWGRTTIGAEKLNFRVGMGTGVTFSLPDLYAFETLFPQNNYIDAIIALKQGNILL